MHRGVIATRATTVPEQAFAIAVARVPERGRVLTARTRMAQPDLVLLDEPAAGLALGAREDLLVRLTAMTTSSVAAIVLVTDRLKEIPAGFDRALVLTAGTVLASGPIEEVLTGASLSAACGLPLEVDARAGRFSARVGASTR